MRLRSVPYIFVGLAGWLLPSTLRAQSRLPADTTKARQLEEVIIQARRPSDVVGRLADVTPDAIYAGRRSEIIDVTQLQANLATNPARQLLARVPGANVPEIDGAGVQLSVGVRGLNPHRISEFNARQNGYDIAADPLGYPESYYTPPLEAVERVEVVRGAASLQYGPQFGGLLNFILKTPPTARPFTATLRQTGGSFGLSSTAATVGGTAGKWSYLGFGQFRRGDGWRDNNGFTQGTAYGTVRWQATARLRLTLDLTAMRYGMQQPGGRTDAEFAADPRGSSRNRNWYRAQWLLPAIVADYALTDRTHLNVRAWGLVAHRYSLGNLTAIDKADEGGERDFLADHYRNAGTESRVAHAYSLSAGGWLRGDLLVGARLYRGHTTRQQGKGPTGDAAEYRFLRPGALESFDYEFPSWNAAAFVENVFHFGPRLTLTPGARLEYLSTASDGYYRQTATGPAIADARARRRTFPLLGLSTGYQLTARTDLYAGVAQNYAAVSFNDLRVSNPNLTVDPNLKDQRGYSAEAGYRGVVGDGDWLTFDVGAFTLYYNDRIGQSGTTRTNVAASRSMGAEAYAELHPLRLIGWPTERVGDLSLFTSYGFTDARYVRAPSAAIDGKRVEMAPRHVLRTGLGYRRGGLALTAQVAHTSEQFTDATNARAANAAATVGLIPAYTVADLGASYAWRRYTLGAGITNLTDARYFTRRATGYPGPGILPSDGRGFYGSLEVRL
ncbi:MAG: TonB-dependent receptor [Hymenobacteraceae bacterium]|nr:TonB-dependent receptor [Hymenobacteraceae bacterium]